MSTPRTELLQQVELIHRRLKEHTFYNQKGGMAVFVTSAGLRWSARESREYPKLVLQFGERSLAGVYTRDCPREWMEADVLAVAEPWD